MVPLSSHNPLSSYPAHGGLPMAAPRFGQQKKDEYYRQDETVSGLQEFNLNTALEVIRSILNFIPNEVARKTANKLIDRFENALFTDKLSQIHNRMFFDSFAAQTFREFKENKKARPMGLMMLDLDGFKQLNDTHGHAAGDEAILKIATMMKDVLKDEAPDARVCRVGGDEFAIVLPQTSSTQVLYVADAIRGNVPEIELDGIDSKDVSLGISQGIVLLSHDTHGEDRYEDFAGKPVTDLRLFKRQADKLLYAAKDRKANGEKSPVELKTARLKD